MENENEDWGGWTIDLTAPRRPRGRGISERLPALVQPRRLSAAEIAWLRQQGQEFHDNYEQIRADALLEADGR